MAYIVRVKQLMVRERNKGEYKFKPTDIMDSPEKTYLLFQALKNDLQEKFIVLNLNARGRIMNYQIVGIGTGNACLLSPKDILRSAILCNATTIILVHNHLLGNPEPSDDDIKLTIRIKEGAKLFDIEVLDHIIIGFGKYQSMREAKIL